MRHCFLKGLAVVLAAVMTLAFSAALAETDISVTGNGETLVPADSAVITLGVSAREKDVLEAQQKVNAAIASVREALMAYGVEEENINTDYMSIWAYYDYSGETEMIAGYNASSTLAIRVTKMETAGEVIDTAFRAGANTLNGISFSAENTDEARANSLKAAVADAKAKAETLAEAAGLKITGIKTIAEGNTWSFDSGANNFSAKRAAGEQEEAADAAYGTLVQAAKLVVSATVTVVFEAE